MHIMASHIRRPDGPTPEPSSTPASFCAELGSEPPPDQCQTPQKPTFMTLPTEIHLDISKYLIYPDALSLKHTNRHLYGLVNTGVWLKVDWLLERRKLHLECPNDRKCELGSDLRFCRGSVPLLMKRRREHIECESRPGLGCLVFGTKTCSHRPKPGNWGRLFKVKLTVELWGIMLALVPLLFAWVWMLGFIQQR